MGYVSLTVTIVCFILLIIVGETVRKECNQSHNIPVWVAAILGCLIGAFGIGHLIAKDHGGEPIGKFHNGDVYLVVFVSAIADDSRTVLLGLRKLDDGRSASGFTGIYPERAKDSALRIYRVPSILMDPISSYHPPFEIEVFKTGDAVSFSHHTPEKTRN